MKNAQMSLLRFDIEFPPGNETYLALLRARKTTL